RVQVFDSDGNFITQWGTSGTRDGQFNRPDGILFDGSEKLVYVTDRKNNRIQIFNTDGQFVSKWNTLDARCGTSIKPRDIALGSGNEAYIVDKENSEILIYKHSSITTSTSSGQTGKDGNSKNDNNGNSK